MPQPELRIVSLIASATEIVHELGLSPFLVGRSHECDFPPGVEALPCCTKPRFDCTGSSRDIDTRVKQTLANAISVYKVFDDVLEALQPTHILTQTQCEVCAVSLKDLQVSVAGRLASRPRIVALDATSIAGIWEDMRRVARETAVDPEPALQRLQDRMRRITEHCHRDTVVPRVACIEWLDPLMAAGNWVPELVQAANGSNLFGEAGLHSPWMNWDELIRLDPDVMVIMPCGFGIKRTRFEMKGWEAREDYLDLRAVREGSVILADGNPYFNRPGPRIVDSLQILAEILHPETVPLEFEGRGYVPLRPGDWLDA